MSPTSTNEFRLLDFYATWCEPCKWSEPIIAKVIEHFNGLISLEKIDIDRAGDTTHQYHVRSVPTFVLLHHNKEVWRMNGFDHAGAMISYLQHVIEQCHE